MGASRNWSEQAEAFYDALIQSGVSRGTANSYGLWAQRLDEWAGSRGSFVDKSTADSYLASRVDLSETTRRVARAALARFVLFIADDGFVSDGAERVSDGAEQVETLDTDPGEEYEVDMAETPAVWQEPAAEATDAAQREDEIREEARVRAEAQVAAVQADADARVRAAQLANPIAAPPSAVRPRRPSVRMPTANRPGTLSQMIPEGEERMEVYILRRQPDGTLQTGAQVGDYGAADVRPYVSVAAFLRAAVVRGYGPGEYECVRKAPTAGAGWVEVTRNRYTLAAPIDAAGASAVGAQASGTQVFIDIAADWIRKQMLNPQAAVGPAPMLPVAAPVGVDPVAWGQLRAQMDQLSSVRSQGGGMDTMQQVLFRRALDQMDRMQEKLEHAPVGLPSSQPPMGFGGLGGLGAASPDPRDLARDLARELAFAQPKTDWAATATALSAVLTPLIALIKPAQAAQVDPWAALDKVGALVEKLAPKAGGADGITALREELREIKIAVKQPPSSLIEEIESMEQTATALERIGMRRNRGGNPDSPGAFLAETFQGLTSLTREIKGAIEAKAAAERVVLAPLAAQPAQQLPAATASAPSNGVPDAVALPWPDGLEVHLTALEAASTPTAHARATVRMIQHIGQDARWRPTVRKALMAARKGKVDEVVGYVGQFLKLLMQSGRLSGVQADAILTTWRKHGAEILLRLGGAGASAAAT